MSIDTVKRLVVFLTLILVQLLVFNRIQLFHCVTPLLYVYFVLMFPRNYPKWATLLWSFAMGLTIDVFCNTPGVSCASLTLVAAVQPYLLELFVSQDAEENMPASAHSLGWGKFLVYALLLVFLFCLAFYTLEAFSFSNSEYWLVGIGGTTVLTLIIVMAFENWRD